MNGAFLPKSPCQRHVPCPPVAASAAETYRMGSTCTRIHSFGWMDGILTARAPSGRGMAPRIVDGLFPWCMFLHRALLF